MSEVIQKYSDAATLSLAAYVEFLSPDDSDAITRIKLQREDDDGNFSNSQANL